MIIKKMFWMSLALFFLCLSQPSLSENDFTLSRLRNVRKSSGAGGYFLESIYITEDPVPPLGDGDLDRINGRLSTSALNALLERYVDRILATYQDKFDFPKDLVSFLKANPKAKEVFLTALNFRYDNIRKAAAIFHSLCREDPKKVVEYIHLATAIAVVHDDADALESSRFFGIFNIETDQFGQAPNHLATWQYFTNPKNANRFAFKMKTLPWPVLVHLVDNAVSPECRRWALSKYRRNVSIDSLYSNVPYDYSKMSRGGSKLGRNDYSLPNLLSYGGVCGDQAHFASRVAKCFGIPALKIVSEGRYGGGHCFAGYLSTKSGHPTLAFTGRYFYDHYYTGLVFDPQTRTQLLDRYIAMLYDGAAKSYPRYNQSTVLVRMAEDIKKDHPDQSVILLEKAIKLNYFNMWAWPLLMEHFKQGNIAKEKAQTWFKTMVRNLRAHPDMTFQCLKGFLDGTKDASLSYRSKMYEQVFKLYGARPDLQLKLRMMQAKDLISVDEKSRALEGLVKTICSNVKEGMLVLPATEMAIKLAKELDMRKKARAALLKAEDKFPKVRGNQVSEAYTKFCELLNQL